MESRSKKTFGGWLSFALTVFSLLAIAAPLRAQYRASLQGTVSDPQGKVIPDATVTLTSKETNISKAVTTSGLRDHRTGAGDVYANRGQSRIRETGPG
jgi:hypothetical protein